MNKLTNTANVCNNKVSTKSIKELKKKIPPDELIERVVEVFKILSAPSRLKILYTLKESTLCVHSIAEIVQMEISAVSHQLKLLKLLNLVKYEKRGKEVYYSLADEHILSLIDNIFIHITETY